VIGGTALAGSLTEGRAFAAEEKEAPVQGSVAVPKNTAESALAGLVAIPASDAIACAAASHPGRPLSAKLEQSALAWSYFHLSKPAQASSNRPGTRSGSRTMCRRAAHRICTLQSSLKGVLSFHFIVFFSLGLCLVTFVYRKYFFSDGLTKLVYLSAGGCSAWRPNGGA
jgi:hypothetical protein